MIKVLFCFLLVIGSLVPRPSEGRVFIDVGKAKVKKGLVAFPHPLLAKTTSDTLKIASELRSTIQRNLSYSGFFDFIATEAYLGVEVWSKLDTEVEKERYFSDWKSLGADFLIKVEISVEKEVSRATSSENKLVNVGLQVRIPEDRKVRVNSVGEKANKASAVGAKLVVALHLYHVSEKRLVFSKKYKGYNGKKIAHISSNDIVKALTGKKGIFLTKLLFARKRGLSGSKEIFMMNWDGSNLKQISRPSGLAFSPAWSPDGKKISYTAFVFHKRMRVNNADLFIYDVETQKTSLVSYRRGTNSGATFHPNGQRMIFSLSGKGSTNLKLTTLQGDIISSLTKGPGGASNISPSISPDGEKVVFISDRSGRPMLYTMSISGTNIKKLTNAGKYSARPAWSPDGKTIAFASFHNGAFNIFSIDINGNNLKNLTRSFKRNGKAANSENPTFSPDGRYIVFNSNRTGRNQLYMMLADGREERRLTFDEYDSSQPVWSPHLE